MKSGWIVTDRSKLSINEIGGNNFSTGQGFSITGSIWFLVGAQYFTGFKDMMSYKDIASQP